MSDSEDFTPTREPRRPRTLRLALLVAVVSAAAAAGVTALLVNIAQRKQEARNPFYRVVTLDESTEDPAVWGRNFPYQYDSYRRTVDQQRTRFGGSEAVLRTPTRADPRTRVAQSRLAEDPRLVTMWAGYAFAVDFREERGHAWMLDDQTFTQRQQATRQPGACIHCHASVVGAYRRLGDGDIFRGFDALNHMPYAQARQEVRHPVACIDCHDPATMALRVTRPAFIEGQRALRRDPRYDPNTTATRQEMRSFVCGQCHVEYYFRGAEKRLTFPWENGLRADEILQYYERNPHDDWTHRDTGAAVLKAQHPEFEMWNQGVHARAGVACADCHMPYGRVGAVKISEHHVRSPLLNIHNACQTCHPVPEAELRSRAESLQARTMEMRGRAMDVLVELINALRVARNGGVTAAQLADARLAQRRAQFLLDFVEAENSSGFHAPQEAARVLFLSLDHAHQGLRALGSGAPVLPTGSLTATASMDDGGLHGIPGLDAGLRGDLDAALPDAILPDAR